MNNSVRGVALTIGVSVAGLLPSFAMPTAGEIKKVAPIVEDLMRADVAKMRSGKCKPSEVGENAVALAKEADTQAAKYYLLTSALPYFAKDGKYDRIVSTLDEIKASIPDLPPAEVVELVEPIVVRAPKSDVHAESLRKMVTDYRSKERSGALAERMRQEIARNPADRSLHTKLAEYMAVMGNWNVALTEFAQGDDDEAARIAKSEQAVGGIAKIGKVADFWWDYADGRGRSVRTAMRQHAVDLYRAGIAEAKITGLAKVLAERRIAKFGAVGQIAKGDVGSAVAARTASVPVKASSVREYALGSDVKLNFCFCAAGKFTMGWPESELKECPPAEEVFRQSEVTISKDFWMSETFVSERMWASVMGGKSDSDNPKTAVKKDVSDFLEKCNEKFANKIPAGYTLRIPTYAEYEYALKSGGKELNTPFAKFRLNGDTDILQGTFTSVANSKPNMWNIRGMRVADSMVWISDRLSFNKSGMSPTSYKWDATGMRVTRVNWPKSSVDPRVPNIGGKAQAQLLVLDRGRLTLYGAYGSTKGFIRLVLAPKAKKKKK